MLNYTFNYLKYSTAPAALDMPEKSKKKRKEKIDYHITEYIKAHEVNDTCDITE